MVITTAIPASTATCLPNVASATVPRVMTMISADRMKSVRTAPLILSRSSATRSTAGSVTACASSVSCAAVSPRWRNLCASFSKPSQHRKAPPSIKSGVIAHGASALMASAAGTRINLLRNEPFATAHTTCSSRSALTPATCWALSARSSPSTPAVFLAATLVITDTSSRMVAMSSSRASRLVAIGSVAQLDLAGLLGRSEIQHALDRDCRLGSYAFFDVDFVATGFQHGGELSQAVHRHPRAVGARGAGGALAHGGCLQQNLAGRGGVHLVEDAVIGGDDELRVGEGTHRFDQLRG